MGSVPDHYNKVNISVSHKFFDFPVHVKITFILYCSILSAIAFMSTYISVYIDIIKMRHEIRRHYWKNGTDRLA